MSFDPEEWEDANPALDKTIDRDEAWFRFQLLLLEHGASIRDTIPDKDSRGRLHDKTL